MTLLEFNRAGFEVDVGDAVGFGEFVAAGDGDVGAGVGEVGGVGVVAGPDELETLLAAGGGVWDDYGVVELGGVRVGVGFEPAFYLYVLFYIIFRHNQHVEDCRINHCCGHFGEVEVYGVG